MDRLSARRAFVVEGAHLYGQLLDFDNMVADQTATKLRHHTETSSHARPSVSTLGLDCPRR